jgi:DNA-directed RNA polymerase sigma subunit (sigma70/sigma32)
MGWRSASTKRILKELESRGVYHDGGKFIDLNRYSLQELKDELQRRTDVPKEVEFKAAKVNYPVSKSAQAYVPPATKEESQHQNGINHKGAMHNGEERHHLTSNNSNGKKTDRLDVEMTEQRRVYTRLAQIPIKNVWREYKGLERENPEAIIVRNYLAEQHMHLVTKQATRIKSRLPDEVSLDDLISVGTFGLIDAIEGFNLSLGVTFNTYSAHRIRGAILDELREIDWVPRVARNRSKKVEEEKRKYRAL